MFLEGSDAILQTVNFLNRSLQRKAEGVHGAFEALEEIAPDGGNQVTGLPLPWRSLGPVCEVSLCLSGRVANRRNAQFLRKGAIGNIVPRDIPTGNKGNLITKIG